MAKEVHICHFSQSKCNLAAYRHKSINLDSNTKHRVWKGDLARAAAGTADGQWGWQPATGTTSTALCFLGAAEDDWPVDMRRCRARLVAGVCGHGPARCTSWRVVSCRASCREVVGEDPSTKMPGCMGGNYLPEEKCSRRKQTPSAALTTNPQAPTELLKENPSLMLGHQ